MTREQASRKIRHAWVAGIVTGIVTLLITLAAMAGTGVQGFNKWNLLDVFLIFFLTFGIYMRSRAAAIAMFVYFLLSKITHWTANPNPAGIIAGLLFLYLYLEGARGALAWHRLGGADEKVMDIREKDM